MNNKVLPIDFNTFKNGNTYSIINTRNNHIFKAIVEHFRKGVAIAHTSDFDCLINILCEIIFIPTSCYSERTEPGSSRIIRDSEGKYIVSSNKDKSAPGKDYYRYTNNIEAILDENCITLKGLDFLYAPIYKYPMGVPYERGKIILYKNKFLDLETLKTIYEIPNNSTLHIKSEVINGWCDIEDEKYFKKLLVEVNKGEIISYNDITGLESFFTNNNNETYLNKYVITNSFIDDLLHESLTSNITTLINDFIQNPFNNLSEHPVFFQWINFLKHLSISYKKTTKKGWNIKINISGHYLIFEMFFFDKFYIIKSTNHLYEEVYIYKLDGLRINKEPYYSLRHINDKGNTYPNKLLFYYSVYNSNNCGILSLDNQGLICEHPYNKLFKLNTYNRYCYKNIGLYGTDAGDLALFDNINKIYYDLEFNKIKGIEIDSTKFETIIENYYYRTPDKQRYILDDKCIKNILPFVINKEVKIPSEVCIKKINHEIHNKLEKRNKYVRNIHLIESLYNCDTNSTFYIFEYQPFGKMNMKGEYKYDIDPNIIII